MKDLNDILRRIIEGQDDEGMSIWWIVGYAIFIILVLLLIGLSAF